MEKWEMNAREGNSDIGRRDLLRLMHGLDRDGTSDIVDSVIEAFGYRRRESEPDSPRDGEQDRVGDPEKDRDRDRRPPTVEAAEEPGIWICDSCEPHDASADAFVPIDDPAPIDRQPKRRPRVPPLYSSAEILSLWNEALTNTRRSREVNVPAAVRILAEARPVVALPRLARTAFTSDVVLMLDRRERLRPMWDAQAALFVHLHALLDRTQCRLMVTHHDPDELYRLAVTDSPEAESLPERCRVLVVSDFDALDAKHDLERQVWWARWLRQLSGRGNTVVTLGVGEHAPERECTHVDLFDGGVSREAVETLVASMARAHLPKTDRLRHLRLALNGVRPCGLAEEIAVWNHADRRVSHAGQWSLRSGLLGGWLRRYSNLPKAERGVLDSALCEWRVSLPSSQTGLEALLGSSANLEPPPHGGLFTQALRGAGSGSAGAERLHCWLRAANSALRTAAPAQRSNRSLQPLFEAAQMAAYVSGLPQPLGLQSLERAATGKMRFVQIGRRLTATERQESGPTIRHGSWPWLDAVTECAIGPEQILDGSEHRLRSTSETIVLKRVTMPRWAESFCRSREGVHAAHRDGARFLLREADAVTRKACWQPIDGCWSWASDSGVDGHGLWAAFEVDGVEQRLRWIPPGEFLMGSSEMEEARQANETLHRVTLTDGYWLAETACTQVLWEAVTGKNPSRFKGAERPAEQVSWNDVQVFCAKLNERLPGLHARLPTEAEWEYAARAGTEAAFWWGDELTTEQANYNGNFPYPKGAEGGEYRKETVEAKAFEVNPWGLYQVHGNVWEWCEDQYGKYPEGAQVNSTGPETGVERVMRGGSWFDLGQYLRAAYRKHFLSGSLYGFLGFRLAAGQFPEAEPR